MKVPPLVINLKSIEKHDKGDKHEKHEKHKEHKKHKKHKKHKHKHHHHDHEHSSSHHSKDHTKDTKLPPTTLKITINPPLLEPSGPPESEHHHLFPFQSAYAPPSPVPYPHVLHPVPTPPSQLDQQAKLKSQTETDDNATAATTADAEQPPEAQPPILEDKAVSESVDESKQSEDNNERVTEPPAKLDEAPKSAEDAEQQMDTSVVAMDTQTDQDQSVQVADTNQTPSKRESNTQMSFLNLTDDGSVRLNILGPIKQSDESNEKILNLEQVCGQLQDGLDVIPSDINEEDCKEQHQVNPVEHIDAPTFGSHLPMEDSTFANLTKEDSETLLEIYGGNQTAFDYAESLQNFASGTNYLMKMVDSLLDLLTEGKHNKEAVPIRQKYLDARREEARKAEVAVSENVLQNGQTPPLAIEDTSKDTGASENRSQDKMDVDAQSAVVNQKESDVDDKEPSDEVQQQLNEIDTLLADLRKMQEQRLSSSPAPVEPDEAETKLADQVLEKMTKLIKEKAKPSEICESSSILKALGIPLDVEA